MQMVLAPCCAFLSQHLSRRGFSSRVSRGILGCACVTIAGVSMACMQFVEMGAFKIILIGLSFSIGSVIFTLGSTLIGEISPRLPRGASLGVTNSIHTIAGLFAPIAMGFIVDVGGRPAAWIPDRVSVRRHFRRIAGRGRCGLINPDRT